MIRSLIRSYMCIRDRIVGDVTHEQLLESCPAYQEIARSQLSESELKGGGAA